MKHWGASAGWWYWLATVAMLGGALAIPGTGVLAAVAGLTALQTVHFRMRTGSWRSFPVQVRATFLLLLLAGTWPPLGFVHWLQLVGTAIRVVFDYCPLARTLSLLPWNRVEPLGPGVLRRAYLTPPSQWRFVPPTRRSGVAHRAGSQPAG